MGNEVQKGAQVSRQTKGRVLSVRLDEEMFRRVKSYAASTDQPESTAACELIARGLAADGLGLYGDEVADLIRSVMAGTLAEMDRMLEKRYDGMPCRFSASGDVGSMIEDAMRAVLRELGEGENDHEDSYSKYATYVSLRRGGTYYVAMSDTAYAFHTNSSCQRLSRSIVTSARINDREAQYRYFCPVCSHW